MTPTGPLQGRRVVELAGLGPAPFAAMLLADMGADVLRIERTAGVGAEPAGSARNSVLNRGRRSVAVDLKQPRGRDAVLALVERADALLEGFRPGVAERLGLGPEPCLARSPRLVYGRMTGWGQEGPLAASAGHDIDYIAIAGALDAIGPAGGPPVPPLNLVGDFGGGGMLLAFGVVCGMLAADAGGEGQVVDAAMVDGTALLLSMCHGMVAAGQWQQRRGSNLLDGGAPFYGVYETADGGHVAVGALEPQFFAELLERLGLDPQELPGQADVARWPELRDALAAVFRTRTRQDWRELLEGTDACVAPVLSMTETAAHPHNRSRGTFVEVEGVLQAAPAPRFSRTPGAIGRPPAFCGEHSREALLDWGVPASEVDELIACGAVAQR
ncbi:MAG TPA: CaiB/BaiF CoA-transferase family protein [Candidatus Dormibacteraeota bacterium]